MTAAYHLLSHWQHADNHPELEAHDAVPFTQAAIAFAQSGYHDGSFHFLSLTHPSCLRRTRDAAALEDPHVT